RTVVARHGSARDWTAAVRTVAARHGSAGDRTAAVRTVAARNGSAGCARFLSAAALNAIAACKKNRFRLA
ncbi:MAG: hypothetical protein C4523_01645, partial [Myxococcales bacterium]